MEQLPSELMINIITQVMRQQRHHHHRNNSNKTTASNNSNNNKQMKKKKEEQYLQWSCLRLVNKRWYHLASLCAVYPKYERKKLVYLAKIAEEANQYEEMVEIVNSIARLEMDMEMSEEERQTFADAYKHLTHTKRLSWKTIQTIEQQLISKYNKSDNNSITTASSLLSSISLSSPSPSPSPSPSTSSILIPSIPPIASSTSSSSSSDNSIYSSPSPSTSSTPSASSISPISPISSSISSITSITSSSSPPTSISFTPSTPNSKAILKESKLVSKCCGGSIKESNIRLATKYRLKIEDELRAICQLVFEILDSSIVPHITSTEGKVFFIKMRADYLRYLAEISTLPVERQDYVTQAQRCYSQASRLATVELRPSHPLCLSLGLSFALFFSEVLNEPDRGSKMAKATFDAAVGEMEMDARRQSAGMPLWTDDMLDDLRNSKK